VTITGAIAAALGLLMLLAGLLPPRRRVIELDTGDPHLAIGAPAASLHRPCTPGSPRSTASAASGSAADAA